MHGRKIVSKYHIFVSAKYLDTVLVGIPPDRSQKIQEGRRGATEGASQLLSRTSCLAPSVDPLLPSWISLLHPPSP